MKKCEFRMQISSSLFSQFKNLIAMANNGCWNKMKKKFRYFTKEMTSPKFWPASPRCATGQLFYGPEVAAMHQPSFQHLPRCNQLLYVQEHDLYLERGGFRNLVLTWDFVRKGQYGQEISKSWRCQNLLNPNPQHFLRIITSIMIEIVNQIALLSKRKPTN